MTPISPDWIALESRADAVRAWPIGPDGEALTSPRTGPPLASLPRTALAPALTALFEPWRLGAPTPVLACGPLTVAPHATPVPCAPMAAPLVPVQIGDPRIDLHLVPGLSQAAPPGAIRGPETLIAGFLATDKDFDGVACLPGPQTSWVRISAGEVVSFQSALTLSMADLLVSGPDLRHAAGEDWSDDAFSEAVSDTLSRPEMLASRLASLAAEVHLGPVESGAARARLHGHLIGAELAATRAYWLGMRIALIGDRATCTPYATALASQAAPVVQTRAEDITLRGLATARRRLISG